MDIRTSATSLDCFMGNIEWWPRLRDGAIPGWDGERGRDDHHGVLHGATHDFDLYGELLDVVTNHEVSCGNGRW